MLIWMFFFSPNNNHPQYRQSSASEYLAFGLCTFAHTYQYVYECHAQMENSELKCVSRSANNAQTNSQTKSMSLFKCDWALWCLIWTIQSLWLSRHLAIPTKTIENYYYSSLNRQAFSFCKCDSTAPIDPPIDGSQELYKSTYSCKMMH